MTSPVTQYMSGNTLVDFDIQYFTGGTLQVRAKPDAPYIPLELSTEDGSIVFLTGNTFQFIKPASQLSVIRAGIYQYDFYLSNDMYEKYAFMSGQFMVIPYIST